MLTNLKQAKLNIFLSREPYHVKYDYDVIRLYPEYTLCSDTVITTLPCLYNKKLNKVYKYNDKSHVNDHDGGVSVKYYIYFIK